MVSCETDGRRNRGAVAIAGVAGSGKTTLGRAVARTLRLPLLDLDSLTNPLLDQVFPERHWLSSPQAGAVRDGRYAALRCAARDVMETAGGVVLVAPFTAELGGGPEWELLREAVLPAALLVVHLTGDEALFAARRAARGAARDLHRRASTLTAPAAIPAVPLDAGLTTGQQVIQVREFLNR